MRKALSIIVTALLLMALAGTALANDNVSAKIDFHVSDALVQSFGEKQIGAVAHASSGTLAGDKVRVTGSGTFNTAAMTATGSGAFVHTTAAGQVQGFGTWTATGLDSFTLFACGPGTFPANVCGGIAVLNVHTTGTSTNPALGAVEHDGRLTVDCEVGRGTPGKEGIKLNIPGVVNFDVTEASEHGQTVFISRSHSGG